MDDVHHGTPDYPENCDTTYVPFAQDAAVPFGAADFPESGHTAPPAVGLKTYTLIVTAADWDMEKLRSFLTSGNYQFSIQE